MVAQDERPQEDERLLVLNMLKEGKLTPEEAEELLAAIDAAEAAESGGNPGLGGPGSAAPAPDPAFASNPVTGGSNGRPPQSESSGFFGEVGDDIGDAIRDALSGARDAINEGLTAAGDLTRSTLRENHGAARDAIRQSVRQAAQEARNAARIARIEARRAVNQARMEARRAAGNIRRHGPHFGGAQVSGETVLTQRLKPGGCLSIQIPRGNIEITGTGSDKVEVEAHVRADAPTGAEAQNLLARHRVSLTEQGTDLLLKVPDLDQAQEPGSRVWVDLEVQMPRETNLTICTSQSDIEVSGTAGSHRIQVVRGDIEITGATGRFDIKAKQGDIELDHCTAEALQLEGDHGDIEAKFTPEGNGPFVIQTLHGDCEVTFPDGAALNLEASAVGGEVEANLDGGQPTAVTSHSWQGKVNGGGPVVRISSVRGDINVRS